MASTCSATAGCGCADMVGRTVTRLGPKPNVTGSGLIMVVLRRTLYDQYERANGEVTSERESEQATVKRERSCEERLKPAQL